MNADEPGSAGSSITQFRTIVQRDSSGWETNLFYRLHRPFSVYTTYLLFRLSVTANQVTAAWVFLGVICGFLFAKGGLTWMVAGALGLQLVYHLDVVDGELAKAKDDYTPMGVYLDSLGHYLVMISVIPALGYGLAQDLGEWRLLYLGIGTCAAVIVDHLTGDLVYKAMSTAKPGAADNVSTAYAAQIFPEEGTIAGHRSVMVLKTFGVNTGNFLGILLPVTLIDGAVGTYFRYESGASLRSLYLVVLLIVSILRALLRFRRAAKIVGGRGEISE